MNTRRENFQVPEGKPVLITKKELQEAIKMRGPVGGLVASAAMRIMGLDKANWHYSRCAGGNANDFAARAMKEVGVGYDIKPVQLEYVPREGPFIMLANHHYGGLDGMMTLDLIGHIRPDYRTVSTFLLGKVPEMKPTMFPVNPFTSDGTGARGNLTGIRNALKHIKEGGCLGLFAAGAVATYQPRKERTAWEKGIVEDCPWPASIVKFIRTCNCPVLPVYFEGGCSERFHRLGRIHPMLRTANLVNETINKQGRSIPMRIGKPVSVEEMNRYGTLEELYGFLRNRIYAMQAEFEPAQNISQGQQPATAPTGTPSKQDPMIQRVSFGNGYPKAIQSLIVWFFKQHYPAPAGFVARVPQTAFVPYYRNVRPDQLLSKTGTADEFDRLLREISDNAYGLPGQVMTLFNQGARVISFNTAADGALEAYICKP
ncbi:MAG: hypothetical protein IJJ72_10350 [Bacteroidales bacterium]|nr:hypothetical protein [Bacteroidales bacterium]